MKKVDLRSDTITLPTKEMLDSKWAKQTPNRAKKLSKIVKAAG